MASNLTIKSLCASFLAEPVMNTKELAAYFLEEILRNVVHPGYSAHGILSSQPASQNLNASDGKDEPLHDEQLPLERAGTDCPSDSEELRSMQFDVDLNVTVGEEEVREDRSDVHISSNTKEAVSTPVLDSQTLCSPGTHGCTHGKRKADQICVDCGAMNDTDDTTCPPVLKKIKPFDDNSKASNETICSSQGDERETDYAASRKGIDIVPIKRMKISQDGKCSDSSVLSSGRIQPGELDSNTHQNGSQELFPQSQNPVVEGISSDQESKTAMVACEISAEDVNIVEENSNATTALEDDMMLKSSAIKRMDSEDCENSVMEECKLVLLSMVEQVQNRAECDVISTSTSLTSDAPLNILPIANNSDTSDLQATNRMMDDERSGSLDVDHSGIESVATSTPDVEEAGDISTGGVDCLLFSCSNNVANTEDIVRQVCAGVDDASINDVQSYGIPHMLSSVDEEEVDLCCMDSNPMQGEPLLAESEASGPVPLDIAGSSFPCCFTPASQLLSQEEREIIQDGFQKDFNVDDSDLSAGGEDIRSGECSKEIPFMRDDLLEEAVASTVTDLKASERDLLATTSLMETFPQDPDEVIPIVTHQELDSMGSKQAEQLDVRKQVETPARVGIDVCQEKIPAEMGMKNVVPYSQILEEGYATPGTGRGNANKSDVLGDGSRAVSATSMTTADDQTVPSLGTSYNLEVDTVDIMLDIEESIHSEQDSHLKRNTHAPSEVSLHEEEIIGEDTEEDRLTVPDHLATLGQPLAGVFQWKRPLLVTDMTTYLAHPDNNQAGVATSTNEPSSGGTVRPLPQCQRKMRVGLSRRQRINPLHARRQNEQ